MNTLFCCLMFQANGDHKISLLKKIRSPSDLQIKLGMHYLF